jgi:hypothetical protein
MSSNSYGCTVAEGQERAPTMAVESHNKQKAATVSNNKTKAIDFHSFGRPHLRHAASDQSFETRFGILSSSSIQWHPLI